MKVIYIVTLFLIVSCTNISGTEKALHDLGYYPIEVGGYGWFDCGKDDFFATRFKAYSQDSSRVVSGCVCEGVLKGKTIRLD
jgi:hypothetical protein